MRICFKCKKSFDELDNKGEVLEDSDDFFCWYCNECSANIRPANETRFYDACQYCKKQLKYRERLSNDVVLLHLDCYDKLLGSLNASLDVVSDMCQLEDESTEDLV